MTCPYCSSEMTEGYLQSGRPILWFSGKKDGGTIGGVKIRQNSFVNSVFSGDYRTGHYCPQCKKIILSLE